MWALACKPTPKDIEYGYDMCHYCKMTIVDQQHAAEAVTSKGKAFMFDAIECMINFEAGQPETDFALLLVCDYARPGSWIDARQGSFLISPAVPSPMGAFLSAFESKLAAEQLQSDKGGEVYDWESLKMHLRKEGLLVNGQ